MSGTHSLPHLQDLIKRDSQSYKDEFLTCYNYMLQLNQSKEADDYILFISQVINLYPPYISEYVKLITTRLQDGSLKMESDTRMIYCRALIMLRNKNLISALDVMKIFFRLFRCPDKKLRKMIFTFIVNDVKAVKLVHNNAQSFRELREFIHTMLNCTNAIAAKKSLEVLIALYKKHGWRDGNTVNAISTACFRKESKILVTALQFFIGGDEELDDSDDSDNDVSKDKMAEKKEKLKQLKLAHRVGKKSKKRLKRLNRALATVQKKSKNRDKSGTFNLPCLHLIRDPQGFTERLFSVLQTTNERFEVRLLMMDVISRLIGVHHLQLSGFYTFLQQYLKPHQREVPKLLLFAAQASHTEVPPDWLESLINEIVDNFVTERVSGEGQAVGLNSIREIVARCPFAINADIVAYLTSHRSSTRNANVMASIHGLLGVLRRENPAVLSKRDRGKPSVAMASTVADGERQFGEIRAKTFVEGAEILKTTEEVTEEKDPNDSWESCSDDSDDSEGEWITLEHSSDEEEKERPEEKLTEEESKKRAEDILCTRILTQDEFKAIRNEQLRRQTASSRRNPKNKKDKTVVDIDAAPNSEIVTLSAIESLAKKSKSNKEERMETVLAGREGRAKYGYRVNRMNAQSSTTNREKRKNKPFDMVKHKVRGKAKRSFQEKQLALRKRLRQVCKK